MVTEENNPSPPASPYPFPLERAVIKLGAVVNSNVQTPVAELMLCAGPDDARTAGLNPRPFQILVRNPGQRWNAGDRSAQTHQLLFLLTIT